MVIGTADIMLVKMCVCFTVQQRGVIIMFVYFIHYHQNLLLDNYIYIDRREANAQSNMFFILP